MNFKVPCHHKSATTIFKCAKISIEAIIENRRRFYKSENKVQQDIFLTRLLGPCEPKKRGKSLPRATKRDRELSGNFYLAGKKRKEMHKVCKQFFVKALGISNKRLQNINKVLIKGKTPEEKRGGDRKSFKSEVKKNSLRKFLNGLPASESHYSRNKSKRIYLSAELNCKKLLSFYNDSVSEDLKISRSMFYEIFLKEFNIGFKLPSSDVCSTCLLWKNKIKNEKGSNKKQMLMVEKRVHSLRANAFYGLMRLNVENSISFCFDLQKVQPLPKTPIQDAYYSRQISLYNLCVVGVDAKNPQFYTWLETQSGRGSLEVGSAIFSHLMNMKIPSNINIIL